MPPLPQAGELCRCLAARGVVEIDTMRLAMRYLLTLVILCSLCIPASAKNQFGYGDGGSLRPYPGHRYAVRMVREKIRIEFLQTGGYAVLVDYLFKNEGPSRTVTMCLPVDSLGERSEGDLAEVNIRASGHRQSLRRELVSEAKVKKVGYDVLWVTKVKFERNQSHHMRVRYRSVEHGKCGDVLYYTLAGCLWRGRVAETSLMLVNVAPATGNFAYYSSNYYQDSDSRSKEVRFKKQKNNLYARWTNWNPVGDFMVD